jgi:2-oxoglutarate dehydrogenase E1 component
MSDKKKDSFLFAGNEIFLEELYDKFLQDPSSIDPEWQDYFAHLKLNDAQNNSSSRKTKLSKVIEVLQKEAPKAVSDAATSNDLFEFLTKKLIQNYRSNGHLLSNLNPLSAEQKTEFDIDLYYTQAGFTEADLKKEVLSHGLNLATSKISLHQLITFLKETYTKVVGFEFEHLTKQDQKDWLYSKAEGLMQEELDVKDRQELLKDLSEIEGFEQFIHTRYPGAKRFSVEGTDTGVTALKEIINASARSGVKEVIIGMAHRGRLNVLTKILGKNYQEMFSEFQGNFAHTLDLDISGDVKYHLGKSADIIVDNKYPVHLSLAANPSHLEAVNPVVQGKVRAKQDVRGDIDRNEVIGILVHGEAAFCGQGVVAESLSISDLNAYHTGGIIHIVLNNQVGFTTLSRDARISRYPTEFAKIIGAPIIHVNADKPEEVIKAAKLAAQFRARFKKDVVIDVVGYRRYGHNEGDEPMFTQPIMYKKIKDHSSVFKLYSNKLIKEGVITEQELELHVSNFSARLTKENELSKTFTPSKADWLEGLWDGMKLPSGAGQDLEKTGISDQQYEAYSKALTSIPAGFNLNSKIKRLLETREKSFKEGKNFDWAMGEALAFASLLDAQIKVRMTGQDSKRGTFSHRHAVFFDQENEAEYIQVNNINDAQKHLEVHNSNLSEFAVLGFEYGYSTVDPNSLTIWEAQFGDFVNGAQVIIDQFIASAEEKWLRMSGLVMLLPHGYEGQGPEHSSARLERFLQLCAQRNMQVVNCTTPANFFHVLRRQVLGRKFRKPLIVMSPKSLLRHKLAVSAKEEFLGNSYFQTVIDESLIADKKNIKKIVLCSGKIYYDLLEARAGHNDVALIRIEQLYPFPKEVLANILKQYPKESQIIWAQEEPQNMGAWYFIKPDLEDVLNEISFNTSEAKYIGRKKAASPAAGYLKMHNKEQAQIIEEIFNR